jgi:hypothetical protein
VLFLVPIWVTAVNNKDCVAFALTTIVLMSLRSSHEISTAGQENSLFYYRMQIAVIIITRQKMSAIVLRRSYPENSSLSSTHVYVPSSREYLLPTFGTSNTIAH